jgi:DNA-binding NarL/FixJ family response regulator
MQSVVSARDRSTQPVSPPSVTCLVADDHPAVLAAVCAVFEDSGVEVVAKARDGAEALEQIALKKPQVALLDVRMPHMSGIEVAKESVRTHPETAILLYTGYAERALVIEALDAGARGFVLKEAPLPDLVRAVETVADGRTYVDPVIAGVIASAEATQKIPSLTQREREVLRLLADGHKNEEIGRQLFISPETVRTHVRKAMAKLEADTRTQAVATALREQLIT